MNPNSIHERNKTFAIRLLIAVCLFSVSPGSTIARAAQDDPRNSAAVEAGPIAGCPMFPSNNYWNAPIDNLPVDARSNGWINTIGRSTGFHMDFGSGNWDGGPIGIPYNVVGSGVPKVNVSFLYDDESDSGPYPIPSSPLIEFGSDHHILIVDSTTCTLYELYNASHSGGVWHAGSGAIWDLNANDLRPDTWTSADAAGLPILPGLVRYDEIAAGVIDHAIRFTAENTNKYIWPARHLTSDENAPQIPPMGARFRLKASFDISSYPAEMQVILTAMKTYGIVLADNGSNWYVSGAPDSRWDNDMLHLLDDLTGDDFEAVDTSSLMVDPDSGATGSTISGNVGASGVTLSYTDGTARTVTSSADGSYSLTVTNNWSGTVTPSHPCYDFNPANRTYNTITSNAVNQDYAPTASGEVCVASIVRTSVNNTNATTVDFLVTFTEPVAGVDATDFALTKSGISGGAITNVDGSDESYVVTVSTGSGNGTIRLDLVDDDSIVDNVSNPLGGAGNGNGDFTSGEVYSIVKSAPLPGIPMLLAPANGTLANSLQPALDWSDTTPLADHYQIQISSNSVFTSLAVNDANVPVSTYTPASALLPGKLYYWRVKAFNVIGGASGWSAVRNFKTPLTAATLVSPSDTQSLLVDRPDFDWDDVSGATQYVLQVSASNLFSGLLVNVAVNSSHYSVANDLVQNKTLYWRVQAKTAAVSGPWSVKWSFKTGNPPSVPVLVAPASNALLRVYAPIFNWNDSTTPSGTSFKYYQIQVDDNSDFSSPVIDEQTAPNDPADSQYASAITLDSNSKFFWRVRAANTVGLEEHVSGWSPARSFRTAILAPQGLTVVPNAVHPLQPAFQWGVPPGTGTITNYTIQISRSANFSTLLVNSTTAGPGYSMLKDLPPGQTIYWRVRANGANGPSGWTTEQFVAPG
jgi:hypothetical protein